MTKPENSHSESEQSNVRAQNGGAGAACGAKGGPDDEFYMKEALTLARESGRAGEIPVGAVIVWDDGRIVGRGRNRREQNKCALCHAEIEAIDEACRTLGGWRLHRAVLYVTMEPCPMCAGAIVGARIPRVVFGVRDEKSGAFGSVLDLNAYPLNHKVKTEEGLLKEECASLLSDFFSSLREKKSGKKE